MRKHIWMGALCASMLMACSSGTENMQGQIDVLPAFENLTELKVSQLGKNIRYVPLETTDSSSCKLWRLTLHVWERTDCRLYYYLEHIERC